jgi:hypothetical protein
MRKVKDILLGYNEFMKMSLAQMASSQLPIKVKVMIRLEYCIRREFELERTSHNEQIIQHAHDHIIDFDERENSLLSQTPMLDHFIRGVHNHDTKEQQAADDLKRRLSER